jgi:DNA-binding transcriptional MerR regulator
MDKATGAYRTISEVADELDIPQHVLRFWETRFAQIKPMKRSGGRRYYRPSDVLLLRGIRRLLYGEGYTIKGVQRILSAQGIGVVQQAGGASGEELAGIANVTQIDDLAPAGAGQIDEEISIELLPQAQADEPEALADEPMPAPSALSQDDIAAIAPQSSGMPRAALSPKERHLLQGALEELAECARLLEVAREIDAGGPALPGET